MSLCGAAAAVWAPDGSACDPAIAPLEGEVMRLSGSLSEAVETFGRPDVIHDSGMWLVHNHALARLSWELAIPRIVSTRGMLEPWALRHKAWKKRLAWAAYQKRDLRRAQLLHATSEQEAGNFAALDLDVPVVVVPNGVEVAAPAKSAPAARQRTALFLGRIYPVKGLPMLIKAWDRLRPDGWRLEIAGPDEGGHQAEIAELVARCGLGEVVSFPGPLAGEAKSAAFARAELLVLPSHSESFGMVVAEALAHSLPVLTTTAVPWPQLETSGSGWRVDAAVEALVGGLRTATSQETRTLREMGARGRELVSRAYGWPAIASEFMRIYQRLGQAEDLCVEPGMAEEDARARRSLQ